MTGWNLPDDSSVRYWLLTPIEEQAAEFPESTMEIHDDPNDWLVKGHAIFQNSRRARVVETPNGFVQGVSYGTPIGQDRGFYYSIPLRVTPYGQGVVLMLLGEVMKHLG
ncbi:MAG: hypothetical protein OWU33_03740 [Firmicutes bacterium]|nr:hypothetical protein [Bacillota bacterium]